MNHNIAVSFANESSRFRAYELAKELNLPLVLPENCSFQFQYLIFVTEERLELKSNFASKDKPFFVNFDAGKIGYRLQHASCGSELLSKAIGFKGKNGLTVLDATAGFASDSCVLARLGCEVTMIERSPVIAALVRDGLFRGKANFIRQPKLILADARDFLLTQEAFGFDIVYLDPMYPSKSKSAKPKKEMLILRAIVGDDSDSQDLFKLALSCAQKRVVVKRSRLAEKIVTKPLPDLVFAGQSSRFDVYLIKPKTVSCFCD